MEDSRLRRATTTWVLVCYTVLTSLWAYTTPDLEMTLIETVCLEDGTYQIKVQVDYSATASMAFTVGLEGEYVDTFSYVDVATGDTICINTGLRGDETMDMTLTIIDTLHASQITAHPFFSEWHYDNSGGDVNEFIEISGPSTFDLSDYQIIAYEAANDIDDMDALSGILSGALGECGAAAFTVADLSSQYFENTGTEAVALVHIPSGEVVDFISHGGMMTPTVGPAVGLTSVDVGPEVGTTTQSMQLRDGGWMGPLNASSGVINTSFTCPYAIGPDFCIDTLRYDEPYCIDCGSVEISMPMMDETIIHCDPAHSMPTTITPAASVRPGDLFFSEYIEGPSGQNNKCLEIYNGTTSAIDLSSYSIELYPNGSSIPSHTLALSGMLGAGGTYVICNNMAFSPEVDLINTVVINYNGDDAITLSKNGMIIDAIGRVGEDPGSQWSGGGLTTEGMVLRRDPAIYRGDDRPTDAFDPSAEWIDGGVNDPSDLGQHTITPAPVTTFSYYDNDPALGGMLIAEMQSTLDTLVTIAESPTTIWVTSHLAGTACESEAVPVTILVHPEETNMSCLGSVNVILNEDCSISDIIPTASLGDFDPRLLSIKYKAHDGRPISADALHLYAGERLIYELIDSCTMSTCWGHVLIESKRIPSTIMSEKDTVCCSQRWEDHVEMSLADMEHLLRMGCYGEHTPVRAEISEYGGLCDTSMTIIRYTTDFTFHKRKKTAILYSDTLITIPTHLDSVISPGSRHKLDSLALVDTIVIQKCTDFDPTPANVMAYWSERLDPDDRYRNGTNEGIPYAYPYLQKDSVIVIDTSLSISSRETTISRRVRIDTIWTYLDEKTIVYDTTEVISIDTIPVFHALDSVTSCNIHTSYTDHLKPGCHPDDMVFRTWSVTDWCHSIKREMSQYIIVEDREEPVFGVLPVDVELLGTDSLIINRMDTIALTQIASFLEIDLDEIVQLVYVRDPFECTADLRVPRFKKFEDNCTEYEDIIFEYSFGNDGPYVDPDDPYLIHGLPLGPTVVTIDAIDECGNKAVPHTLIVVTLDGSPPRPICHDTIRVSLAHDYSSPHGINRIPLSVFENGVEDQCGDILITLGLREDFKFLCADHPLSFVGVDYIEVCCEDLDRPIPITISYFDNFGNNSDCWSVLIVEDKLPKRLACDTLRLPCTADLTKEKILESLTLTGSVCDKSETVTYRRPAGAPACGGSTEDVEVYIDEQYYCSVHVIYEDAQSLDPYTIKWPIHHDGQRQLASVRRECGQGDQIVEIADVANHHDYYECSADPSSSMPTWCVPECGIVQASYEIDTLSASAGCYTLIKRWSVIDWCAYEANGISDDDDHQSLELVDDTWLDVSDEDRAGRWQSSSESAALDCTDCAASGQAESLYYRYTDVAADGLYVYDQVFVILDQMAPQLSVASDTLDACLADQTIVASASDICIDGDTLMSADLLWEVQLEHIDEDGVLIASEKVTYRGSSLSMTIPEGSHGSSLRMVWSVLDPCGNVTERVTHHGYVDTKAPTPICIESASTVLMSDGQAVIWATDLDKGSYDDCSDIQLLLAKADRPDERSAGAAIYCDDMVGDSIEMRLYAVDESGLEDFCTFYLYVAGDPCGMTTPLISGTVMDRYEQPVGEARVSVRTNSDDHTLTTMATVDEHGRYRIMDDLDHRNIIISASKNKDHLQGISALDIVTIQRHLLGLEEMTDEYDLIAADVNGDGRISTIDIAQLRQLLLGSIAELPDQDSWLIVPDEYMRDLRYPYDREMSHQLSQAMVQNFSAIKIGDVASTQATTRSSSGVELRLGAVEHRDGRSYVPIYTDKAIRVTSLQLSLKVDGVRGVLSDIFDHTDVFLSENQINIISSTPQGVQLSPSQPIIYLELSETSHWKIQLTHEAQALLPVMTTPERGELPVRLAERYAATEHSLHQNNPNPFSIETIISYELVRDADVELTIYTSTGEQVYRYTDSSSSGRHDHRIGRATLAPGVYIYQLRAGDWLATRRMVVID